MWPHGGLSKIWGPGSKSWVGNGVQLTWKARAWMIMVQKPENMWKYCSLVRIPRIEDGAYCLSSILFIYIFIYLFTHVKKRCKKLTHMYTISWFVKWIASLASSTNSAANHRVWSHISKWRWMYIICIILYFFAIRFASPSYFDFSTWTLLPNFLSTPTTAAKRPSPNPCRHQVQLLRPSHTRGSVRAHYGPSNSLSRANRKSCPSVEVAHKPSCNESPTYFNTDGL